MRSFAWDLPFGANLKATAGTHFRLWAPKQEQISVQIEGGDATCRCAGSPTAGSRREAPCGAGTQYRYLLGSGLAVPDPASRAQADDVHGPSLVVDPRRYPGATRVGAGGPGARRCSTSCMPALFGGFAGVQRELTRLADLGVTAVELMPVNDFPGTAQLGL